MKLLVLGGISEAKTLAQRLFDHNIPIIYSIQGKVRTQEYDFPSHVGGFSQYCQPPYHQTQGSNSSLRGLETYINDNKIDLIIDSTHPCAIEISTNARQAAKNCGIDCLQYYRAAWNPNTLGELFHSNATQVQEFDSYQGILAHAESYQCLFWATGHKSISQLLPIKPTSQRWVFRTAKQVIRSDSVSNADTVSHPNSLKLIKDIGPFSVEHELSLFKQELIDALICKNSGGTFNEAKIQAALTLGIPILLLKRPDKPIATQRFSSIENLFDEIINRM